MKVEKVELVRGSGNVFRDLGRENADVEQLNALLAAEVMKALDRSGRGHRVPESLREDRSESSSSLYE